jgi:quinol-cytochrome oxidoreductase complex cytochrome b subunit
MLGYVPVVGAALQRVARGGEDIGVQTMVAFYTLHTSIVPALLVFVLAFHFWRVRKAGGVVVPPPKAGEPVEDEKVLFLPHLLVREAMLALVIAAVVVVLGAALGAPLGDRANAGMSPNPAKAPWYFMGFQELLLHVHPLVAVLVVPVVALIGLMLLPYVTADDERHGQWFLSGRGLRAAVTAMVVAVPATVLAVVAHEIAAPHLPTVPGLLGVVTSGLLPMAIVGGVVMLFARFTRRRYALSPNEATQTVVVLLAVALAVLTIIGVWFRGPGMALSWPWQEGV